MNEYIKKSEAVDVIVKYPYDIAGKTATAIKMIKDLPSADVVLRAELAVRSFKDAATIYNLQEINKKLLSEVDYWKQQTFNACMNNGCLDPKIITQLLENADGHDDPTGEQGADGLEAAISYAKSKLASEIFEKIEKIILDNTYPDFDREHKPVNIWKAKTGYDAFEELKKKYTEDTK